MTSRLLPMFPIGTVLYPQAMLPLHVFEPRYRVMMRHCIDTDNEFGVVLIERGSEVGGGDVRFPVGTLARIVQASQLDDGRYAIAAVGLHRIRVLQWMPEDPYPLAEVDALEELPATSEVADARDRVFAAFAQVLALWHRLDERVPTEVPAPSPDAMQDLFAVAAVAPLGPLDAQRVLEADGEQRGALLESCLADLAEEIRARLSFE
jgi:Lon protease-like protein